MQFGKERNRVYLNSNIFRDGGSVRDLIFLSLLGDKFRLVSAGFEVKSGISVRLFHSRSIFVSLGSTTNSSSGTFRIWL